MTSTLFPDETSIFREPIQKGQTEKVVFPAYERVLGRRILEFSPYCGSYGMGGPGFLGFKLEKTEQYSEEWLIQCIWGGGDWLSANGQWIHAHPDQYEIQQPLMSNVCGAECYDNLTPLLVGNTITTFDINKTRLYIVINNTVIAFSENPYDRPPFAGTGKRRKVYPNDDLRDMWVFSEVPNIAI